MAYDTKIKPAPKEFIYVDKDMKPCAERPGVRKAKYIPEYELYVIERSG